MVAARTRSASSVEKASTAAALDPATPLRLRERLAYGIGDIGTNLIYAPVVTFLLFYFTDVVGIGAAIAGTLLLLGRILDGTLDLFIGTLIDRTRTRWGKARPWLLLSIPVFVGGFIGLFNIPAGLDQTGKEIWAFVFYFLCLGLGFISSNLAYSALTSLITTDSKSRVSMTVIRSFCATFTGFLVNFVTLPAIAAFGGGQQGWSSLIFVYGGIAAVTLLVVFLGTRERVITPPDEVAPKFRELWGGALRNPYFYIGFFLVFLAAISAGTVGAGVYYTRDVLGDQNLYGLLSLAQLLPLIIGMWFMPLITSKIGKRIPYIAGALVIALGGGIALVDPSNVTLAFVGAFVRGIGGIAVLPAIFAIFADIVDYGEWRTGRRVDGLTYAAVTTGQNFGGGLAAAMMGWLLAAGNYQPNAESQPDSAIAMEIFLFLGIPVIAALLQAIFMYFLKIDKVRRQMLADLEARRQPAAPEPDPAA